MTAQTPQACVEVVSVLQIADEVLTFVKLLSGSIEVGMLLEAEETGERWRISAFGLIPAKLDAKSVRGVSLEAMDNQSEIRPGMRLFVKD